MKKKIILKIAVIVGILSIFLIPSTYAIFKGSIGSSSALSIAGWNVTLNQTGVENHLTVIPSPNEVTATYNLNVTSNSEVDAIYTIVLSSLPSGVSVKLDNGSFIQESSGQVTFSNAGIILYSDVNKTKTHTLTFKAATTTPYVTNDEVDIDVMIKQYPVS